MSYVSLQPQVGECSFGYCGFYRCGSKNEHEFAASYQPMNQRETLNFSFLTKPSMRLQLFTELKGKLDKSSSELIGGFRLKFQEAFIVGYMTSQWRTYMTYMKVVEQQAAKIEFNTMLDFKNARKPCSFGVNLHIGLM
jgi:hypothetical protein